MVDPSVRRLCVRLQGGKKSAGDPLAPVVSSESKNVI